MRRLLLAACVLSVVSCGPASGPNHPSPWSAPSFFADIPADTPYVVAAIDPLNDALRARLVHRLGKQMKKWLDAEASLVKAEDTPAKRALSAVIESMRGTDLDKWNETIGLAPSPRIALYGIGVYPVFRVEVLDAQKLRALATKAIAAAGPGGGIATAQQNGITYWTAADGKNRASMVMAVLDHEAVIAFVPTAQVAQLLPSLLGIEHPQASLADSTVVPDTLKKFGFNRTLFMSIDIGRITAAITQMPDSPVSNPECKADFGRLAAWMPRLTAGYRKLDADGYAGAVVIETSPLIAEVLGRVRTQLPRLPRDGAPMFELAAGIDIDALIDAVRTAVHQLRNEPFKCAQLAQLSEALDGVAQKLDTPLPPEAHGMRGIDFVLDDFSTSPVSGRGGVLAIGEHVGDLIAKGLRELGGVMPGMASLSVANDGVPVALPVAALNLGDIKSAHLGLHDGKAAFAVGDDSEARVKHALAAPPDTQAPFMSFEWDMAKTIQRVPTLYDGETKETLSNMRRMQMSLDLRDGALDFEIDAGWP